MMSRRRVMMVMVVLLLVHLVRGHDDVGEVSASASVVQIVLGQYYGRVRSRVTLLLLRLRLDLVGWLIVGR